MTAATRILRRLVRRATKPLRLAVVNIQVATVEQNIAHYQGTIVEAKLRKQDEAVRLSVLAAKRIAIREGLA